MGTYFRPADLAAATAALADGPWRLLAGGTDIYPWDAGATGSGAAGLGHPEALPVLDLSGLTDLGRIEHRGDHIAIGAAVTWTRAADSRLPAWFDGVRLAAVAVGGRQIQNRGTLVGNLCNASPAADGVPPLLALDASVRLCHAGGTRDLPLADFMLGNRRTARRPDELVSHILIPTPAPACRATFLKLGARAYLVISIVSVAVTARVCAGRLGAVRIAVGACSAVPRRLPALEARVEGIDAAGLAGDAGIIDPVRDLDGLAPIDDIRASANYRHDAAAVLVRRALAGLLTPAAPVAAA